MKLITLDEVIEEHCKDKEFAELFQKELLINEIACAIVKLRKAVSLTQQEFADKAGTTQPVVARLEKGKDSRVPSLDLLSRLAFAADARIKIVVERNGKNV